MFCLAFTHTHTNIGEAASFSLDWPVWFIVKAVLLPLSVNTVYMVIGLLVIIKTYFVFNTSAWRPFHSNPDPVVTVPHPLRLPFMWGCNTWWLSYHCKGILDHSSLWRCFSSLRFAGTAFLRSHHSIEIWTLTRWLQQWFSPIFSHFVAGLLLYLGSFFRQCPLFWL